MLEGDITEVTRRTGNVLWRQVSKQIAGLITSGNLKPGMKLPNEIDLAEQFNVSRGTVRRAMAILENEGTVRIEQGRGTFVHSGMVSYPIAERTRFTENLRRQGLDSHRKVTRVETIPCNGQVADELELSIGDLVTVIEISTAANGMPLTCGFMYFPEARFPGLARRKGLAKSISNALKSYGVEDYVRRHTRITTRPPTDVEARSLAMPRSRWVLCTEKTDVDLEGRPICYSQTAWAGDLVEFIVEN